MQHDIINQAINAAQGFDPMADPFASSELLAIQSKAIDQYVREHENRRLNIRKLTFPNAPSAITSCRRTQEIIDAIKDEGLALKVYEGEGLVTYWTGEDLSKKESFTIPQIRIKDDRGNSLTFDYEEFDIDDPKPFENYGKIHTTMYEVERQRQGSYYKAKRFIIGKIKPLLLDKLGYNTMWGRATWSINTKVKGDPAKEDDWRTHFAFVGWDSKLMPIYINKLVLMYFRMGFIADPYQAFEVMDGHLHALEQRTVVLLSEAAKKRTHEWLGEEAWSEFNKYSASNVGKWKKLQREREKEISPEDQRTMKAQALAQRMEEQNLIDEMW